MLGRAPGAPTIIPCPDCYKRIRLDGYEDHRRDACNPSGIPFVIVVTISEKFEHLDFAKSVVRKAVLKYPEVEFRMPKGNGAAKELAYYLDALSSKITEYKSGREWEAGARNRALISGWRHYDHTDSERIGRRADLVTVFSAGTSKGDNPWDLMKSAIRICTPTYLYVEERGKKKVFKQMMLYTNNPNRTYELGDGVVVLRP